MNKDDFRILVNRGMDISINHNYDIDSFLAGVNYFKKNILKRIEELESG